MKTKGRLIAKLIFLALDIATILFLFFTTKEEITLRGLTFTRAIGCIAIWYIVSAIELLITVIFNFAHQYDDYDGVGDFFKGLSIAPIALLIMTFRHVCNTIAYMIQPSRNTSGTYRNINAPTLSTASSQASHQGENTSSIKPKDTRASYGIDRFCSNTRNSILDKYRYGRERTTYGFVYTVSSANTRVIDHDIYVDLGIDIEVDEQTEQDMSLQIHIESTVKEIASNAQRIAENELRSYRRDYKDLDRTSKIIINPTTNIS